MGSICVSTKQSSMVCIESKDPDPQLQQQLEEVEAILYPEYKDIEFQNINANSCLQLLQEIDQISILYLLKELNEQRQFLKLQIQKPLVDLINWPANHLETMQILSKYSHFLSQVQEHRPKKVLIQQNIVPIEQAIHYWNQQIILIGGKLRMELALTKQAIYPPTAERFVKTREWIKKNIHNSDVGEEGDENHQLFQKVK